MPIKQYIVDAFSDRLFGGNPAAVCVLHAWLSEKSMQKIARENNLSETAFCVKEGEHYHLRWFTPKTEIDLCGHATMATAFVLFSFYEKQLKRLSFLTKSGELIVEKQGELLEMDFPAFALRPVPVTKAMQEAIGIAPLEAYLGRDLLCVLPSEEDVRNYTPDPEKAKQLEGLVLHTTARGNGVDCVSRSFAPKLDVAEDPVCGSGHCHIVPYWAKTLNKESLVAYQASERGGTLYCNLQGDRLKLAGHCALFAIADLFLEGDR